MPRKNCFFCSLVNFYTKLIHLLCYKTTKFRHSLGHSVHHTFLWTSFQKSRLKRQKIKAKAEVELVNTRTKETGSTCSQAREGAGGILVKIKTAVSLSPKEPSLYSVQSCSMGERNEHENRRTDKITDLRHFYLHICKYA